MKALLKNIGSLQLVAVLFVIVSVFAIEVKHKDLHYALDGWSPLEWTAKVLKPENFARDFANGVENYKHSSIMWVYPALQTTFGVPALQSAKVATFLEILITAFLFCGLYSFFNKDQKHRQWVYFFITLVILASNIRYAHAARFSLPFWNGLYYVFADVARISGLILLLGGKYRRAALALAIAYTIHPAVTIHTLIVAFFAILPDYKNWIRNRSFYLSATCLIFVMGVWTYFNFDAGTIQGALIPKDSWIHLTQLMNSHWYPNSLGIFSTLAYECGFPLISYVLLAFYFTIKSESPYRTNALAALVAVTCLTFVGWINAEYIQNQTLIKLSFQRSSDFIYFIGLPFVVHAVAERWRNRSMIMASFVATYLIAIYLFYGPNLYLVIALILFDLYLEKNKETTKITIAAVATVAAITFINKLNPDGFWTQEALTGNLWSLACFVGALLVTTMSLKLKVPWKNLVSIATICLLVTIMSTRFQIQRMWPQEKIDRGTAFRQAQEWAKANTEITSLFLLDPTIIYGWRDFSERSSFGNFREWLHTSWLYNSDVNFYNEGMRRFSVLNIDLKPYTTPPVKHVQYFSLLDQVLIRFYDIPINDLEKFAQENKVNYLVLQNIHLKSTFDCRKAFTNSHYTICEVPDIQ